MVGVSTIFLSACKKNDTKDPYFIKFQLDNEWLNFQGDNYSNSIHFYRDEVSDAYSANIVGSLQTDYPSAFVVRDQINITIYDTEPLKVGKLYSLNQPIQRGELIEGKVNIIYTNTLGDFSVANVYNPPDEMNPVPNEAELQFDEITSSYVKGRFRAILYSPLNEEIGENHLEGEFYLPIVRLELLQ